MVSASFFHPAPTLRALVESVPYESMTVVAHLHNHEGDSDSCLRASKNRIVVNVGGTFPPFPALGRRALPASCGSSWWL